MPEAQPPRLLYVSTLDRIIGVMLPHLDAARDAGWEVEVACQPTVLRDDVSSHTDKLHSVPLQRFPLHPRNVAALRQLVRIMEQGGFTVVHCHNPTGGFIGRLAATIANRRLHTRGMMPALRVYTAHGFHFHRHGGRVSNLIYRAAETIAGRFWSDAVLTITQEDYDAALNLGVVPANKLFLTGGVGVSAKDDFNPDAVDQDDISTIRHEVGATPDAPIVTIVGEMIPRKRHIDALQAWTQIAPRFPNAVLLLVGDGKLDQWLQEQARNLGISESVRFLGFRRDIRRVLAATNVFLFPSGQEGLPCAIQEALAMQVPTVATDVRGNRDLVDASCGRLVALGDTRAMADKVCELLSLPAEARLSMGRAGRQKMLIRFERSACIAEWQCIYRQILDLRSV